MKSRSDKGRLPPFVPVFKDTTKTNAWRALSHGARSLYVALKGYYNRNLGNGVYLSTRSAVQELGSHSHRDNVRRWFRELEYYGFIVMVTPGHLGVEGRGKAPHWRLTEEWFAGRPPTRDFQLWNGEKFHERKSPKFYTCKKQNPGPPVRSTADQPSGPVLDHQSGPPPSQIGPPVRSIQRQHPGPPVQAITSLTTPRLETRSEEQDGEGKAGADVRLHIPDDLGIPQFLVRT